MGAIAVTHGYCEPDSQSSTEQWGVHFTKTNAAVQWCWALHSCMNSKSSCEPDLQSSTEQWGMHFTKTSAAVQWCCVTAHLYEQQIFLGATAVTQGYCEPDLQSSTEQ